MPTTWSEGVGDVRGAARAWECRATSLVSRGRDARGGGGGVNRALFGHMVLPIWLPRNGKSQ